MSLSLIVAGLILLALADGQDICNYDPDGIFFENTQLEELRQAIQKGDCSPADVTWKLLDSDMPSSSGDLSKEERIILKELTDYRPDTEGRKGSRVRFPEGNLHSPKTHFEPQSNYHHKLAPPDDFHIFSKVNGIFKPQSFRHQSRVKRQAQQSGFVSSSPLFQRQPKLFVSNNQNNFFPPDFQNEKSINQIRPQDFNDNSRIRPALDEYTEASIKPTNQRRPQNQEFVPNSQNAPNGFISAVDLFKPSVQNRLQTRPNRRQQNQKPLGGLFRPNDQSSSSQRQRRPNIQRRPQNDSPLFSQRPLTTTTPRAVESTTLPGPPTWATPPSLCVQRCPNTREYNPVCGSDRVTYNNPGRLLCERQCGKARVNLNYYGTCRTTTDQPSSTTTTPAPAARTTRRRTRSTTLAPSVI